MKFKMKSTEDFEYGTETSAIPNEDKQKSTTPGLPKLKKLKTENKALSKEVKKLREQFATDRNLKQMKLEAIECIDECKKIL